MVILAKEKYDYYDLEQISRPAKKIRKTRKLKFRKNPRVIAVLLVMAIFIAGLAVAARYAQIATTGYKIVKLKKQLAQLQDENDQLELNVQKMESLDRVEKVAVEKLGMQKPDDSAGVQFLAVEPNDKPKSSPNQLADKLQPAKSKESQKIGLIQAFANLIVSWKGENAKAEAGPIN